MKKRISFKTVSNSIVFKVFLYIILSVSSAICFLSLTAMVFLADEGAYSGDFEKYMRKVLWYKAQDYLIYPIDEEQVLTSERLDDIKRKMENHSEEHNVSYEIRRNNSKIWSTQNVKNQSPYVYKESVVRKSEVSGTQMEYTFLMYVDPEFSKVDELRLLSTFAVSLYAWRDDLIYILGICALLCIVSLIWLLCNAGHRNGQEGIVPGPITQVPLDLLTAGWCFIGFFILCMADGWGILYFSYRRPKGILGILLTFCVEVVWFTMLLREVALRMKLGKGWQNTVVYRVWKLALRIMKWVFGGFLLLLKGLPSVVHVAFLSAFLVIFECIGIIAFPRELLSVCWGIEKLLLVPLTVYIAIAFKELQKGSKNLAEGNLSYKLDTKHLVLDFKEHGSDLNRIGEGMAKAVEQRMQSERLKTELVTNVSHDIKTPLTSVINYADLLGNLVQEEGEALDREKVSEYSEVLLRQSKRLKKLLDDLLEASKATTGNLEVNLAPCEIGVLLSQAAGEYEARFAEKELQLLIHQPQETVRIMADGRHLWRVFDNLFNNICKYAQEGSRVYLNVERQDERVQVIFRNMSKYELNVSAQELEERFVRGDKSRHMEGNGLGLSIASSLVELQKGTLEIVTDGDLFKVILEFTVLEDGES